MTEQAPIETPTPTSTPAEAATRLDQLRADPAWRDGLLKGGPAQTREFHDLHELAAKGDEVDLAMAGVMQPGVVQTSDHMELMGAAQALRSIGIQDPIIKDVLSDSHAVTRAEYDATVRWKSDHMSNAEWTKRLMSGDVEARRQLALANIILTGSIKEQV